MNVKRFSMMLIWALLPLNVVAQPYPLGVRSQAMAGASAAHCEDAEAIFANPALLAKLPAASATFVYSRPFGLADVTLATAAATAKLAGVAGGVAFIHFGSELYRDRYFQAAIARHFGKNWPFAIAIAANLRHLSIRGYGSALALGVNLGTVCSLNSRIQWGVLLGNVNWPAIGAAQEKMPPAVSLGMAFFPRDGWALQADFYREYGLSEELRFGVETRVLPILQVRFGAATNPDRFTAGFAIALRSIALAIAATSHSDLGTTLFYAISIRRP